MKSPLKKLNKLIILISWVVQDNKIEKIILHGPNPSSKLELIKKIFYSLKKLFYNKLTPWS
jgi:hypothetical protein